MLNARLGDQLFFSRSLRKKQIQIPHRIIQEVFFKIDDCKAFPGRQQVMMLEITMAEITLSLILFRIGFRRLYPPEAPPPRRAFS